MKHQGCNATTCPATRCRNSGECQDIKSVAPLVNWSELRQNVTDQFPNVLTYLADSPPLAPAAAPRTIIAFTGLAGAGKSTAALHLVKSHGFERVRFAGPLKAMMAALGLSPVEIDGDRKEISCELLGGRTPRQAMQWLGTEWGRDLIAPDLWIRAWNAALTKVTGNVVIDDCRFPNEADAVVAAGGILVRVERPGAGTASIHSSEQHALSAARILENTGDVPGFLRQVDELVSDLSWVV